MLGVALVAAGVVPAASAEPTRREIGDTKIFATVPAPGQPSGIAMNAGSVLVATLGLATEPATDPRLFAFHRGTGRLSRTVTIPRMMTPSVMALAGVAVDAARRAYVVDMNGRILRVDPRTGSQEVYAEFPATVGGLTTMPFDITFDATGAAYVTDQNLAAIWRIPPGGGAPYVWFQDVRLASYLFGPSGIRLDPSGRLLYFTVARAAASGRQGIVYRIPLEHPTADRLEEIFRYPAQSDPFGIAFGESGKLYVALFGANQVSVLLPDRTEERRFPSMEDNSRAEAPFDHPVAVALDGNGALLVTNSASASLPNPARMVVFDVFVDDLASPLARPTVRDVAP